ncbi:hypothetical protein FOMPIDRAFT_1047261 [Fomitopsis schrenkii]|uniref:Protein kinase domain-containing protein n=1 Tax=Fomitopsis schrenkii TaxID=2126942 RepID=S8FYK4_FOMSC|nr:hypothetical protein FOMPIDRAFT_1047261 [Fomitopsis schrenkii]
MDVVAAQLPLEIGGRFRMLKLIGEGSYGRVYKAINTQSGQQVAVKVEPADQMIYMLEE